MKSGRLVRGAYQFFEPGENPTTQANIVIKAVGKLGAGDLPVTADMEVTGGQSAATIAANLQTWVAAVTAGTGKAPMVYTARGILGRQRGLHGLRADSALGRQLGRHLPHAAPRAGATGTSGSTPTTAR